MGTWNVIPVTTSDYRRLASKRLPRFLFDYIDGGSGEEISMSRNLSDLQEIRLEQRVMRDVAEVSTGREVLGQELSMPLALAPVGLTGMQHADGEILAARAAEQWGVPFTLFGSGNFAASRTVGAMSMTWPNWLRIPPSSLIPSGQ